MRPGCSFRGGSWEMVLKLSINVNAVLSQLWSCTNKMQGPGGLAEKDGTEQGNCENLTGKRSSESECVHCSADQNPILDESRRRQGLDV